MSELIAIIHKNTMDEIRVTWSECKGHRYRDIRVYTEIDGKADKEADARRSGGAR